MLYYFLEPICYRTMLNCLKYFTPDNKQRHNDYSM
jgi:hypothetical protein